MSALNEQLLGALWVAAIFWLRENTRPDTGHLWNNVYDISEVLGHPKHPSGRLP